MGLHQVQRALAALAVVAIPVFLCGCGGGGGETVTTTTVTVTTTITTTTTLSTTCREDQAQCSHCLNHTCLDCNPNYVMEHDSDVPGGRCVAACVYEAALSKPTRPATPFGFQGKAWPQMCIKASHAHIFGIGDWGGDGGVGETWFNPGKCIGPLGLESSSNASAGTRQCTDADKWAQKYVARQMGKVAETSKPDYILNVGDNFYPGGINRKCSNDPHPGRDPSGQWHTHFDQVYGIYADLKGKPWLSVLGNHDYGGIHWWNGWDTQIFATWERDDWILPAQYWSQKVQYLDFSVDYFFIDSNVVDVWSQQKSHYICQGGWSCWNVNEASCPDWFKRIWTDGKKMTEEGLKASTAEWHVIVTHFVPGAVLDPDMKRMHTQYGIDLLITGHQHTQETGVDKSTGIRWIITGGGGGVTSDAGPDYPNGHDGAYGFVDFAINRTTIEFYMHSWGGKDGDIVIQNTVVVEAKQRENRTESVAGELIV